MAKSKAKAIKKPLAPAKKKIVAKTVTKKVAASAKKAAPAKPAAKKPLVKAAKSKPAPKPAKVIAKTKVAAKKLPSAKPVAKATVQKAVKAAPAPTKVPKAIATKTATPPIVKAPPAPPVVEMPPPAKKAKAENTKKAAKTAPRAAPSAVRKVVNLDEIKLPENYRPTNNEEYMSPQQLAYFKRKLQSWRQELILESQETLEHLRTETRDVGDDAERASRESDNILELRTRDRYRKLLSKIGQALTRIENGEYGFCEETGEEIGLARLEARPIATLTVDAQERREMFQRQFRDDH